jgi:cytochrome c-type biogenesis protein CcmH/NrfG
MQQILIRHLSGSRANQLDQFPGETEEIIVGREPGIAVQYEAQSDDVVSRQHAKITRDSRGCCQLCDLQSRNGTFLNHQLIRGPVRLSHKDVVQLGTGGPEFRFELDPSPLEAKPTRFINPERIAGTGITREATAAVMSPPASLPVGRATVERMLDASFCQVKKQSTKFLQFALVAALLVLGVASVFYLRLERSAEQSKTLVGQQQQLLRKMDQQLEQQPDQSKATREQIAKLRADLQKSEARTAQDFKSISNVLTEPGPSAVKAQVTPDQDFDRKLQTCWTAFKNNPAEGAKAAASLLSQYPNRWESYGIAGKILHSQSQLSKARYAYQKALGLAPDNVKPQLVAVIQQIDSEAKGAIGR